MFSLTLGQTGVGRCILLASLCTLTCRMDIGLFFYINRIVLYVLFYNSFFHFIIWLEGLSISIHINLYPFKNWLNNIMECRDAIIYLITKLLLENWYFLFISCNSAAMNVRIQVFLYDRFLKVEGYTHFKFWWKWANKLSSERLTLTNKVSRKMAASPHKH